MTNLSFNSFHVKNYRSLLDIKIDIDNISPIVICGENNIGKTNFLRALNIFFNHFNDNNLFIANLDIPHHIYQGSRGAGSKTELIGTFVQDDKPETLAITFRANSERIYKLNKKPITADEAFNYLSEFQYLFIESNNVHLPSLIATILENDGLLLLDKKRSKQSDSLKKLKDFIQASQLAISDIERKINECFIELTDFDGILKDKKIKIQFAEFEKLRDAIKTMTSITLSDGNTHGIESKGSGAQRAIFLALMQYIAKNTKKKILWGIDEPEAFLQPKLQKKVAEVFVNIVQLKRQPIILTTHSQHFVNLNNLSQTYLFKGKSVPRKYVRKPGITFYEINTAPLQTSSDFEKASLIKQHLGINNNDGWEVMPHNIIVEGEEDKKYLEALLNFLDKPTPNIVWSGGASKVAGYLQYYEIAARELKYKPSFFCIFDNDPEGREQASKVKPLSYKKLTTSIVPLPKYDGTIFDPSKKSMWNESVGNWEIEDFIPHELMFEVINKVLRSEKYKTINKSQIEHRNKPANMGKQILKYAEDCCAQNNPEKPPLMLDNEGRKKTNLHDILRISTTEA